MHYKTSIAVVFTILLLGLVLVYSFPSPGMLAFGAMVLPFLLLIQVWVILRAQTQSQKTDEDWYDHN